MKFIDAHCHLDGGHYGDFDGFFARLKAVGVEKVICAGFDAASSRFAAELSERYAGCYFTAGIHPTETGKVKTGDLEQIEILAHSPKCVAIGEIGLDYHYPDTDKQLQKDYFLRQIRMADGLGLPVQIHSRDCAEDMYELIKSQSGSIKHGAMLHCYSHSTELAKEFEKMGLKFSFGGTSTYSGSKKAKRTIAALGLESLITETDSPYLPPKSKYGEFPNTPESIPEIAANMAEIRGMGIEEIADAVWGNAHALFGKLSN